MTTTSTYQGMDADGKPSSRVLNPPGGASNNIFGYTNEPVQKTPIRNNPDNVNRGNNDIFHQSPHAAAAQPKSRAPRSAFNPITGEPYDQPKATPQPQAPSAPEPAAVSNTTQDPSPGAVAAGGEEKPQEPQNEPAPQPAAAAAPAPQKRQQSGGSQIFGGGADDANQHRSTRVSQPPGGRSTKLW